MQNRLSKTIFTAFFALGFAGLSAGAQASEADRRFFDSVSGQWSGPGEIVAGKYAGTKFMCNFTGSTPDGKIGMSLDGGCRVGLFTQRMSANIERHGRSGYRGTFMDGSQGEGLDVVSGQVTREQVIFAINRNALNGAMQARLSDPDTMQVTVSVRVDDTMVPVIGVNLKRTDAPRTVGSTAQNH
ncbi:MAG TPA: hypothetical protein GX700_11575 [Paracoccus sp.]|nr:hypothetical protein [Paracoccus sp. (in: a-proteobacteria)]